ncbi:hypothetical protein Nepgr_012466 [Nepenthes gracilis]|uniref:Uncharacterized protein n=1 Tax=Nepenthes gracilis TaxID=150966 RepID=A0AAD3SFU9_NEPGR|nr:hypothetical protein Nepgr_012466 [Nepenthes gracilis]
MHHGIGRPANHESTSMSTATHQVVKNSTPDVVSVGCGNPRSAEPKFPKLSPVDSIPISPKAKVDSLVNSEPTSGMPGGLEDHSLSSDMSLLPQEGACAASDKNSTCGPGPVPSSPLADADAPPAPGAGCSIVDSIGTSRRNSCLSDIPCREAYAEGVSHGAILETLMESLSLLN